MSVQEIFYKLLQSRSLKTSSPEIRELLASENGQSELDALAAAFDCRIGYFNNTVYLIPNPENQFLGYSKSELKKRLLKGNQPVVYYYLYMFIILTLLNEFYGTSYGQGKSRSYMLVGNLMNRVQENLRLGSERQKGSSQVPYERMLIVYDSLKSELGHKEKNSKAQLFDVVLRFLEEQGLILRVDENDSIRTTERLDDLAEFILRSSDGYASMMEILGGEPDAQA